MVNSFNIIKENISFMKTGFLIIFLCMAYLLIIPAFATVGPVAYQTEQVYADYESNGSLSSDTYTQCNDNVNPCRFGFMEVALPNTNDTLQTVRVNLSGTTDTNLNSKEIYKATASSYSAIWAKTKLYVNDSVFGSDQDYYKITNTNKAPAIQFNITSYSNERGGYDLYDNDNIGPGTSTNNMSFTLSIKNPSSTKNLTDVTVIIQFDKNTGPSSEDSVNITATSPGTASDTDSNNYYDKITWTGNLTNGSTTTIDFTADIRETVNFANGATSINPDGSNSSDKGIKSSYTETSTLTGLTIDYKYSRGPIRQGIDLAQASDEASWNVRGFVRVLAKNSTQVGSGDVLTYNISGWGIYNASAYNISGSDLLQSGTYSPVTFNASYGRIYTTDTRSNDTSRVNILGSKPYIASSFDWYVIWNDTSSYYVSYINTTLDMPTLYKLDIVPSKSLTGVMDIGVNTTVNVTDISQYQGSDNALIENLTILSVIPLNTTNGDSRTPLNIHTAKAYFVNTTGTYELTEEAGVVIITITQPNSTNGDGMVNLTIINIAVANTSASSEIGHNLMNGEKINLTYNFTSPVDLQPGDTFNFTGNTTIVSDSGTPMTENLTEETMSPSARQLIGYKDLWVPDSAYPTLVNGTLVVQVIGESISGIKFVDYVPLGTNFSCSRDSVTFCNSSDGTNWDCGTSSSQDYNVTDLGTVNLSGGFQAHACEYTNGNRSTWTLSSNAAVKIMYQINITNSGLYEMPMEIAGFDPVLGKTVSSKVYGVVRVNVPTPMVKPVIMQTDFLTARTITVGNPVSWVKGFDVYNPNSRVVESDFEIEVFEDTTDGFVSYVNEKGDKVEEKIVFGEGDGKRILTWKSRLTPLESRSYEIRILTPPILETDRDVEVIRKLEDKMVELRTSIFLRSLAAEEYENVIVHLPISRDNIIAVTDGFGNVLSYTGGEGSTTIYIDKFGAKEMKEIIVKYKQSYPKIIVTPDKERYSLDATVNLDILVIHGGDEIAYPYLETEIYTPNMDLVYSNIQDLKRLESIDKTSIFEKFSVPVGAPTGRYITEVRLRSDLATLATGTGNFYIVGGAATGYGNLLGYLALFFTMAILYFSLKRLYIIKKSQTK